MKHRKCHVTDKWRQFARACVCVGVGVNGYLVVVLVPLTDQVKLEDRCNKAWS